MQHDRKAMRALLRAAQIATDFEAWLCDDGDRLAAAAELLGGETWRDHAEAVLAAVRDGVPPTRLVRALSELHRLLSLDFTDDLDRVEAALFFALSPDDPRADDARLCAEALERGLAAMAIVADADIAKNRRAA